MIKIDSRILQKIPLYKIVYSSLYYSNQQKNRQQTVGFYKSYKIKSVIVVHQST